MVAARGTYIDGIETGDGMGKARSGSGAKDRGVKAGGGDWKQIVSGGALIVAVLGTLILAAILRAGPESTPPTAGPARTVEPEAPAPVAVEQPSVPAPEVDSSPAGEGPRLTMPAADPLTLRASRDRDRLSSRAADWTLQFARFCEKEHVERLLAGLASRNELYVIESGGCYSVCWGVYASADLARAAGNIPPALAEIPGTPFPKSVEEALR